MLESGETLDIIWRILDQARAASAGGNCESDEDTLWRIDYALNEWRHSPDAGLLGITCGDCGRLCRAHDGSSGCVTVFGPEGAAWCYECARVNGRMRDNV